jgi:LysM repeat protein
MKNDNLFDIAKKQIISVETLMKVNNLSSNNRSIGQKLKLK